MLRVRVIPIILIAEGKVVKTRGFKAAKYVGDPVNTVKLFSDLGADEIIILDIEAALKREVFDLSLMERIASVCNVPLGVGGGITTPENALRLIEAGTEKVVINSSSFDGSELLLEISSRVGSQALVGSIDYRASSGKVSTASNKKVSRDSPSERVKFLESCGVGEILLTSVEHEGMMAGIDLGVIETLSGLTNLPIILHGGVRNVSDIRKVIASGYASAVGVGSFFMFQDIKRQVVLHYER